MKKKSLSYYLLFASLLFGLYFGAGNLIFPVSLGQKSGANVLITNFGFLLSGIGLPLLGVIAIALSGSDSTYDLASKVNQKFALIFTVLLYLVIGPFFAIPRLATTSYEIGLAPFLSDQHQQIGLFIFSLFFFLIAWYFAKRRQDILDVIGKFLTPILLVLLSLLFILSFINPMGQISKIPVQATYQNYPMLTGFLDGYNTLDALASIAFGIVIIQAYHQYGVKDRIQITKDIIISAILGIGLMGLIYTLLAFMGAQSMGILESPSVNGGQALAQIADHYLGKTGLVLLGITVFVACLKTSIGLLTAFSETFSELFNQFSYKQVLFVASLLPTIFANFGLNAIISISIPVLMFIYPLAIVLILLGILDSFISLDSMVFKSTMIFTGIFAFIDATKNLSWLAQVLSPILQLSAKLPFFDLGLAWLVPAFIGFLIGLLISKMNQ